ncbi:MAG TPA: hypothetical protein VK988_06935 [Acidimicrobiales bacterium]|nr:hypothetical protein [Acidimicrobiales bacterium]
MPGFSPGGGFLVMEGELTLDSVDRTCKGSFYRNRCASDRFDDCPP